MTSRAESAAATRRALLEAAAELLDSGGLDAVTLRAVGARAGVTRGAPYRHFPDKESLLIAVGTRAWDTLGDRMQTLRATPGLSAAEKLRGGLLALVDVGRRQPHLYKLMFSNPPGDPSALARAAQRSQTEFLAVVAELVGEQDARRYAALLISSANGIAGLQASGQLADPKWGGVSAEELTDTLVDMVAVRNRHT
ncbi:TetR family transcriptional regulator [Micromonospora humidisoli]|uniref:TetR/AcrR family transcriptional regulator n=1 Tax=Micromonospora humidisoli TaxID=2807622 RepID=A0ABS2JKC0_9ACTN|nr:MULTISPECIES: TetR/AcrR family transcriptional regulator [Micromonospora]MBM7086500.1 TetR/AcrR family transcriptional regulator [Micromonospora humidisoli]GHJ07020.1 TetR family transcriptional regulator [Micromonospora sp. AKA109]